MKLHHTKYKDNYKKYILDCVNNENDTLTTDEEKIDIFLIVFIANIIKVILH